MNIAPKKRVLVWLSGGVDSAVAAALLLEQGYEVIAGFMKNYADESNPSCHTREDRDMAMKVAAHLGIKTFIIFDFREEYNKQIIEYIYQGYASWNTPNPDVLCNTLIKFDLFLQHALTLGCDAVATGHYARIHEDNTIFQLLKWIDQNKDQSYFLSWLTQAQLAHAHFPLGAMTKSEVRTYAEKIQLPNADRKDSQGLCFIGKIPMKEFLSKQLATTPWPIQDSTGTVLGKHPGALFYTIWQREWLWLSGWPRFVVEKDVVNNILIVGHEDDPRLRSKTVYCTNRHRVGAIPSLPHTAHAKLRYRQTDQSVTIQQQWEIIVLDFDSPQKAATAGQQAVVYDGDMLIGSGVIITPPKF